MLNRTGMHQLFVISKTYLMRPLMWIGILVMTVGFLPLLPSSRSIRLRDAYSTPFDATDHHAFHDAEAFIEWSEDGSIHPEITAMDFTRMDSVLSTRMIDPATGLSELRRFSELQHALSQFPNLTTIKFGMNQLTQVNPQTFTALPLLSAVEVLDITVTNEHIALLSQIESLQWISLHTLDLPASLRPFRNLANLSAVCVAPGPLSMSDTPAASPYRREVLADLNALPALRTLILHPQYLPGIGYFAGSQMPDPACDSILKGNVSEVFANNRTLRRLWIGANQSQAQREQLAVVAQAMPQTRVRSATFDNAKIDRLKVAAAMLMFATMILTFQLTSQFSGPAALLIPRFASRHIGLFCGALTTATCVFASTLTQHNINLLSGLAALSSGVAAVVVAHALWNVVALSGRRWAYFLPVMLVLGIVYLPMLGSYFSIAFAAAADRFLIGTYGLVASLMLAFSIIIMAVSMMLFRHQHRDWMEHAIAPAMTLRELSERMTSTASKRKESRRETRYFANWDRRLDAVSIQLRDQAQWALPRLWQLGQPPARIGAMMIVLALFTWAGAFFRDPPSAGVMQITLHYSLLMLVLMPMMLLAMQCYGRRETLARDLLHPVDREQWIRAVFTSVLTQMGVLMLLALVIANVQICVLSGVPGISSVLRGCTAMAAQTILATGVILWVTVHRGVAQVAIIGCIGLIASGLVCLIVVDSGIGPSAAAMNEVRVILHHPAVLSSLWAVAGATLVIAYKQWQRTEFAQV